MAALVLVFTAGGAGLTVLQPPVFQSTSRILVSVQAASNTADLSLGSTYVQQVVKTYADVATTPFVLGTVVRELKLPETSAELAKSITTSSPLDEAVIDITVQDSSATRAARIANAITARLGAAVPSLAPASLANASSVKLTQVQVALPADNRTSPSLKLNLLAGAALGLLLGLALTVARELLDTRLHDVGDVARVTQRAVIGSIFASGHREGGTPVVRSDPSGATAESYRTLRTNLQFLQLRARNAAFVVTSSVGGEGKTTTAANLALVSADAGERVLIVDADLRRPSVAEALGLDGTVGLTDVLIGRATLDQALQRVGVDGPMVLPAGRIPPNPSELLQADRMVDLLHDLTAQYDLVLLDAPPLLPVTDAAILAQRTSGAIVVAGLEKVRRGQLKETLGRLTRVEVNVAGIVVTRVPMRGSDYKTYGYTSKANVEVPVGDTKAKRLKAQAE